MLTNSRHVLTLGAGVLVGLMAALLMAQTPHPPSPSLVRFDTTQAMWTTCPDGSLCLRMTMVTPLNYATSGDIVGATWSQNVSTSNTPVSVTSASTTLSTSNSGWLTRKIHCTGPAPMYFCQSASCTTGTGDYWDTPFTVIIDRYTGAISGITSAGTNACYVSET